MKSSFGSKLLIALLAMLVFFGALGRKDIVTSHEARVAQTARIMCNSGWWFDASRVSVPSVQLVEVNGRKQLAPSPDGKRIDVNPWLIPVINGQMRLQKPPLPYWCVAISYQLFGVGEWQARLPSALLGAIAAALIWDLALMLLGRRAGVVAAVVWVTTHFVVDEFRKSMADPYLAFFTLMALWGWVRASRSGLNVLWFYSAIALGMIAKHPGILLLVLPILVLLAAMSSIRPRAGVALHLLGVGLLALIALPWPTYVLRTIPNAMDLWRYEALESEEKARPFYSYFVFLCQMPLPWTPLFVVGAVRAIAGPAHRYRRRLPLLLWLLIVVAAFSIKPVKKNAYLLPVAPAVTLIVADELLVLMAFARRTRFRQLSGIAAAAQAMIGIGFSIGLLVLVWRFDRTFGFAESMGAIAAIACLRPLLAIYRAKPGAWLRQQAVAYALVITVLLGLQRSQVENRRSARSFAQRLNQFMDRTHLPLLVSRLPEEVAFYLPLNLPDGTSNSAALVVLDDQNRQITSNPRWPDDYSGGSPILDCMQILMGDNSTRWKLFRLVVDRGRI